MWTRLIAWLTRIFAFKTASSTQTPQPIRLPTTPPPQGWQNLIALYQSDTRHPLALKIASLAQWILESGRGSSALARDHHNYGGIKYRPELSGFAEPVSYVASDGRDSYAHFYSDADFINGYWRFIDRPPYKGWKNHAATALDFLTFIKNCGYAEDSRYVEKVSSLFGEAELLLGHEPRKNRDGKPVEAPPAPETGKPTFPDFKNDPKKPHIYPLNTRYEADPDVGGEMPGGKPVGIVLHHTVSYNVDGTIAVFKRGVVDIHFIIGHKGEVVQMAPTNRMCAHAGASEWNGMTSMNKNFIGIEMVNIGPLTKVGDGFKDYYGREFKGPVRERHGLGHKYWEACTPAQEQALLNVILWALKTYPTIKIENIIGHYECAPKRKNDPYGAFSWGDIADVRAYLKKIT